jgi:outer membrane immunogenic protein
MVAAMHTKRIVDMRRHSLLVVAGLSLGLGQLALAADLSLPPPYLPPLNWTSCYLGGNAGGALGSAEFINTGSGGGISGTSTGFAGGVQVGCDVQVDRWVVGFRNLFAATSLKISGTFQDGPLSGYSGYSNTFWFDTLTGRAGYAAQPNWLWYVQGGGAWAEPTQAINAPSGPLVAQINNVRTGWTVGGGTEYLFSARWSVFVEYNYMNFGTQAVNFADAGACIAGCSAGLKRSSQNILVGLNFRLFGAQ